MLAQSLTEQTDKKLYRMPRDLEELRHEYGRGRSPEAAYVREYVCEEKRAVREELRRRGLPTAQTVRKTPP